jgi:hypothetical protein
VDIGIHLQASTTRVAGELADLTPFVAHLRLVSFAQKANGSGDGFLIWAVAYESPKFVLRSSKGKPECMVRRRFASEE